MRPAGTPGGAFSLKALPMPKRRLVPITRTHDTDGRPIAVIPLANGGTAKMLAADWQEWNRLGLPTRWTLNPTGNGHAYVRAARTRATGCLFTPARVLLEAGRGQIVRYRDGDTSNLRRDNLYLASGPAKRCDATIPAAPKRPPSKATEARIARARAALAAAATRVAQQRSGAIPPG
jgi:hypothetical protein